MGKFDELLKLIGANIEKHGDDAAKILDEVSSPELAVALKGKPREKYLKALDAVQGPKDVRAKDMGFGDKTWYHGTGNDFDAFDSSKLGSHTGPGHTKDRHWFTDNPDTAEIFANSSAKLGVSRKFYDLEDNLIRKQADIFNEFKDTVSSDFNPSTLIRTPDNELRTLKKLGELNDEQIEMIKSIKSLDDEMESLSRERRKAMVETDGAIIPVKLRVPEKIPIKNMDGRFWSESATEIPDGAVRLDNFRESTPLDEAPIATSLGLQNPARIRSVNAAFDKRFAKSPLLLAGAGAVPMTDNFKNPLDYIKEAASAYETTKNKILKPVANQMDLTKDKSTADDIQSILSAVVDPVNLVNGPVGLGLGAAQMLGEDKEKEAKQRALKKLMGE